MSGPLKDYNFQERNQSKHIKSVAMTGRPKPVETSKLPKPPNDRDALTKQKEFQLNGAQDFRDVGKTSVLQNPGAKVHKITLQEYRDRAKSKSPSKPDNANEHRNKDSNDLNKIGSAEKGKTFDRARQDRPRSERAMSTDDVADMSFDLANMSIDNTEDDKVKTNNSGRHRNMNSNAGIKPKTDLQNRETTTNETSTRPDRDSVEKQSQGNRLKLKKAVSSSQCSSKSDSGLVSSSKSYGSLPSSGKPDNAEKSGLYSSKSGAIESNKVDIKRTETDTAKRSSDNTSSKPKEAIPIHLSLADRLKLKAAGVKVYRDGKEDNPGGSEKYKPGSGSSSQTGSQSEVIDLTEDEESPEPVRPKQTSTNHQEPVRPKQSNVNISQSVKPKQTNSTLFEPFKLTQTSANQSVKPKQTSANLAEPVDPKQTSANMMKPFGQNQNVKMSSFQSLSSQSSSKPTNLVQTGENGTSQEWTQMRGQSGAAGSGNQGQSNPFKLASERLNESLQEEINRRNQLTKLLEKQKVHDMFGQAKTSLMILDFF